MTLPDLSEEQVLWNQNKLVAGIDEVGRGCIAGPVVAASVILPIGFKPDFKVNDSKKLSEKQRKEIYHKVISIGISYSVAFIDNNIIDEINILQATFRAMSNSIDKLSQKPDYLLIDGNRYINKSKNEIEYKTIIKGDTKSFSIALASIIAKVERDNYMANVLDLKYPNYHFKNNKGYGTKQHYNAINNFGTTPFHRATFLKKLNINQINLF